MKHGRLCAVVVLLELVLFLIVLDQNTTNWIAGATRGWMFFQNDHQLNETAQKLTEFILNDSNLSLQWTVRNEPRKKIILYQTPFKILGFYLDWLEEFLSVKSDRCIFTVDGQYETEADVLIFHRKQISAYRNAAEFPQWRPPGQLWVFHSEESPQYYSLDGSSYADHFNWTLTYRTISTIPSPFYWVVPKQRADWSRTFSHPPERTNWETVFQKKTKAAYFLATNCVSASRREKVISDIESAMRAVGLKVDYFGRCYNPGCPRARFPYYCDYSQVDFSAYMFYFAFENSRCPEYITEKPFRNGLELNTIPLVWGAPRSDYEKLLPPNSFIFVEDYASWSQLADTMRSIMQNYSVFRSFFDWQQDYYIVRRNVWLDICDRLVNVSTSIISGSMMNELYHNSRCMLGAPDARWPKKTK